MTHRILVERFKKGEFLMMSKYDVIVILLVVFPFNQILILLPIILIFIKFTN